MLSVPGEVRLRLCVATPGPIAAPRLRGDNFFIARHAYAQAEASDSSRRITHQVRSLGTLLWGQAARRFLKTRKPVQLAALAYCGCQERCYNQTQRIEVS